MRRMRADGAVLCSSFGTSEVATSGDFSSASTPLAKRRRRMASGPFRGASCSGARGVVSGTHGALTTGAGPRAAFRGSTRAGGRGAGELAWPRSAAPDDRPASASATPTIRRARASSFGQLAMSAAFSGRSGMSSSTRCGYIPRGRSAARLPALRQTELQVAATTERSSRSSGGSPRRNARRSLERMTASTNV